MEAVDSYLRQKHPAQTATWSSANVRGRCRLFPIHVTVRRYAQVWILRRNAHLMSTGCPRRAVRNSAQAAGTSLGESRRCASWPRGFPQDVLTAGRAW